VIFPIAKLKVVDTAVVAKVLVLQMILLGEYDKILQKDPLLLYFTWVSGVIPLP